MDRNWRRQVKSKIEVNGGAIRMLIQPAQFRVALIGPHFDERMIGEDCRQGLAKLVRNLQEQRLAKSIEQVGAEIARFDVLPDGRLAAKSAQA